MDEREIQNVLMEILRWSVNKPTVDTVHAELTPEVIASVYSLAKKHSLSHLVSRYALQKGVQVPPKLAMELHRVDFCAVYQYERMQYAYQEICDTFEESAIDYIPLKGAVIRQYYPEEDMRTSCDIDILVQEETLETAICALERKGYRRGERAYHDVSLYAPNGTHLELHFNIRENRENLDAVLKDAWKYAVAVKGSRYEFSNAFFVFHMYAHMAYHFLSGGCGIRSLMDIWVTEHRMNATYTCAKELLKKAGIYQFAQEMSLLTNQCFSSGNYSDPLLSYIWRGGIYGSQKNWLTVQKKNAGNAFLFAVKRIFLPYKSMTVLYPFLSKAPVLLPLCWVHRVIKAVFKGKSRKYVNEVACYNNISDKDIDEITEICMRLGL